MRLSRSHCHPDESGSSRRACPEQSRRGPYAICELWMLQAGVTSVHALEVAPTHCTETAARRKVPHAAIAAFGMTCLERAVQCPRPFLHSAEAETGQHDKKRAAFWQQLGTEDDELHAARHLGNHPFAAMFGVFTRLGEVGVCGLEHGILVAVAQLILHAEVAGHAMIFQFRCAFRCILIWLYDVHACSFQVSRMIGGKALTTGL